MSVGQGWVGRYGNCFFFENVLKFGIRYIIAMEFGNKKK